MAIVDERTGIQPLIERIDEAVQRDSVEAVTEGVKAALIDLLGPGGVTLTDDQRRPCGDSYARHLLHRSEQHGYTVIAMVWGPQQGTPVHDHAGMWCVEGVYEGKVDIVQYDLEERDGGRYRFAAQECIHADLGQAGSLIPPFEYHTITNPSPTDAAVTVHVYAGEMESCTIFEPLEDGWYERHEKALGYS